MPGRDPAPLLGTIALPINEILEPTPPTPNVHQPADSVRLRAIDEARGRGRFWGRVHGAAQKGLDPRDVECGVNTAQGQGELEPDSRGANDSGNGEGANETCGELSGLGFQGQVLRGEPYALSLAIARCPGPTLVSLDLHPGRGAKQSGAGAPPRPAASTDEGFH